MKFTYILIVGGLYLTLFGNIKTSFASSDNAILQEQFTIAKKYKSASNTDTAKVILRQILQVLKDKGETHTHLVLSTRLYLADINLKEENDFSIKELLQLIEIGATHEVWDIVAQAHIILGLAYEIIDNKEKCNWHLDQAFLLIEKHQLNALYPRYAVRRSSFYRLYTNSSDSVSHYANEALKYSSSEASKSKADAHLLLGLLHRGKDDPKAIEHFQNAISVFKNLGDHIMPTSMTIHITKIFLRNNQLDSALLYNDVAKGMYFDVPTNKLEYFDIGAKLNLSRANIYKALGQMDSAWHYINLSRENYIKHTTQLKLNTRKVTEVEANHQNEKQAQQLKLEQARRNNLSILFLFSLAFLALLSYFYFRLRKANHEIQGQAKRLAQMDHVKSRFFANISHELRTPLTLILGPVQALLKDQQLSPKQRKLLSLVGNSSQQLYDLINEILNLRKLELDKLEVESKATHLRAFFYRYFAQFESLAERKGIVYSFNIDLDEKIIGKIDSEKCRQILYNLLSNAFKFTPSGEQVKAQVEVVGETLQLSVLDTGIGIHPEDLPHVFERYFQTNQADKAIEGGTGIGLALCREYVELFGGRISVDSQLYEGTRFQLSFPIEVLDETSTSRDISGSLVENIVPMDISLEEKNTTVSPSMSKDKEATILVVEDNIELADYLRLVLSPHYKVVTAENGQEAWNYLLPNSPNSSQANDCQLVLSDLMMPVMDGYQLLEKLKNHDATRHIPVVMLTARSGVRDKLKALRIGVDDYLLKPFEEEELLVRIDNLLKNQAVRKASVSIPTIEVEEEKTVPIISARDQAWLGEFETYVQKNLANTLLSIPALAEEFAMSESTLLRQLKRLIGLSPKQYLKEMRLEKARELLENQTFDSIAKVAYETGYIDPKSFSRAFKKRYGKLPSAVVSG